MANENEILRRVRETVGRNMTRSADFDALSQAIKDKTKENLGGQHSQTPLRLQDR